MGEYIKDTKLGTCEDLYYTTYPALRKTKEFSAIEKEPFLELNSGYRFRFPFPDEVNISIGTHDNYDRGFLIDIPNNIGVSMNHSDKIYVNAGFGGIGDIDTPHRYKYSVNVCCPQHEDAHKEKMNRNQIAGRLILEIVQQKYTSQQEDKAMLVTVVRCPYCKDRAQLSKEEVISMIAFFTDQKEKSKSLSFDVTINILTIALEGYGDHVRAIHENDLVLNFIKDWQSKNEYNPTRLNEYNDKFNVDLATYLDTTTISQETKEFFQS
jgi:hypothetical protein